MIDSGSGEALVAVSEEIMFRRYIWGTHFSLILATASAPCHHLSFVRRISLVTGLGNVLPTTTVCILLMLVLRRSGALWPTVLAHYLVDLIPFVP
jgi:hypothetical protein